MNLQFHDAEVIGSQGDAGAACHGNGHVENARHDPDVIGMVSAEVEKRSAELHAMVSEAAYFRAQRRGFAAGHELEDWLAAEQEIAERFYE